MNVDLMYSSHGYRLFCAFHHTNPRVPFLFSLVDEILYAQNRVVHWWAKHAANFKLKQLQHVHNLQQASGTTSRCLAEKGGPEISGRKKK